MGLAQRLDIMSWRKVGGGQPSFKKLAEAWDGNWVWSQNENVGDPGPLKLRTRRSGKGL